jgi:hypothetical protein
MEKLANHIALQSIAEGGMEKQALNWGQLMRMAKTFASRGKVGRSNKLLAKRQEALERVTPVRDKLTKDLLPSLHKEKERLGYYPESLLKEVLRRANRRPIDGADVAESMLHRFANPEIYAWSKAPISLSAFNPGKDYAYGVYNTMHKLRNRHPEAFTRIIENRPSSDTIRLLGL